MLNRIFHLIFDNWIAKIVVVILAFGLWAFVVNTGFRQAVLAETIPVTPRDVAQNLAIASALPSVEVEVYAPTANFQRLKPEDIQAFVNLAGVAAGEHTLEIKVFADDPNVRILHVEPSLATVVLEKKVTEEFEVRLETEGDLGQGYVADKAESTPESVEVSGAASVINSIDQVVVRIPLNGETSTVEKTLVPQALDKDRNVVSGVTFDPQQVEVRLPVIQAEDAKKVGIEVATEGDPAEGFFVGTISTDPSSATAQGSSKALAEITTLKTEPIDVSGATSTIERTVKLVLPSNVRAEPAQIKVTIEIRAGTLSEDISLPPEIINVSPGLAATVSPSNVAITISGPADRVRSAFDAGLHLRIDASGRGEGDFTVTLSADLLGLPEGVRASFSVNSVTVSIVASP
jgi:YbbR domain-containing protein